VKKGDQIAQLIIEKIDHQELREVAQLDDVNRVDQGFGSSDTTLDQGDNGQRAKPQMEITEILARAFR